MSPFREVKLPKLPRSKSLVLAVALFCMLTGPHKACFLDKLDESRKFSRRIINLIFCKRLTSSYIMNINQYRLKNFDLLLICCSSQVASLKTLVEHLLAKFMSSLHGEPKDCSLLAARKLLFFPSHVIIHTHVPVNSAGKMRGNSCSV